VAELKRLILAILISIIPGVILASDTCNIGWVMFDAEEFMPASWTINVPSSSDTTYNYQPVSFDFSYSVDSGSADVISDTLYIYLNDSIESIVVEPDLSLVIEIPKIRTHYNNKIDVVIQHYCEATRFGGCARTGTDTETFYINQYTDSILNIGWVMFDSQETSAVEIAKKKNTLPIIMNYRRRLRRWLLDD